MNDRKLNQQEIQVNFPNDLQGGRYSNNMKISHSNEEFIMDFLMIAPPTGAVVSRIIVSPGHLKRMINVLQDNLEKYESKFGKIDIVNFKNQKINVN